MEESTRIKLTEAGVDVETAMDRFLGNEELLMRFLKEFSQDTEFQLFKVAMEEERYEDAFKLAHNLKGLSGNLSIIGLFDVLSKMVDFLRNKEYQEAQDIFPEVVSEYKKAIDGLNMV